MKVTKKLLTEMIEEAMGVSIPNYRLKWRLGNIRALTDIIGLQPESQKQLDKLLGDRPDSEMVDFRQLFGEKPYMKWTPSPKDKYHKAKKTTFTKNPGKGYWEAWFAIARAITEKVFIDNPEFAALDKVGKKMRREDRYGDILDFKTDYAYMVGRGMLGDWKEAYRLRDEIQNRVAALIDLQTDSGELDESQDQFPMTTDDLKDVVTTVGGEVNDDPDDIEEGLGDFDEKTAIDNIVGFAKGKKDTGIKPATGAQVTNVPNATGAGGKFTRPKKAHFYNKKNIEKRKARLASKDK